MKNPPNWVRKLLPSYLKHFLMRTRVRLLYGATIYSGTVISLQTILGKRVRISRDCVIDCKKIGDFSYMGDNVDVGQGVMIGKFCSLARMINIGSANHPFLKVSTHPCFFDNYYKFVKHLPVLLNDKPPTMIGNDVWIGSNAQVLRGVTIGDGAVIGAGAVVTKDVSPYAIVGGVPAKLIKYRFDQGTIDGLLKIKWWDWPIEKIKTNTQYFDNPTEFVNKFRDT